MAGKISPQAHVEKLYKRYDNPQWFQLAADITNFAEGTLDGRFINELLQNTDDAGGLNVYFKLDKDQLTITHDGKHFDYRDVEKITSFANRTLVNKSENTEMTGFKGIGFKGTLSLASKVHIISQNYTFCFDKDYWHTLPGAPWQMLPIWESAPEGIDTSKVTFIFKLIHPDKYINQMNDFIHNPTPLLFLRNIKKISFTASGGQTTTVVRTDQEPVRSLSTNRAQNNYLIKTKTINITSLHPHLQSLNTTTCPDRIKNADEIKVTFVFFLNSTNEIDAFPQTLLPLFNTLPTKVKLGIPFGINTEFLLEAQREHLVEDTFNDHIFYWLAALHFECLREIAASSDWKNVVSVSAPPEIASVPNRFCSSYKNGFMFGLDNYAWVPNCHDPKQLLKAKECIIDGTGFYKAFLNDLPRTLIPNDLAHPDLKQIDKLSLFTSKKITDKEILAHLEKIFQQNPDSGLCYRALLFLKDRCSSGMISDDQLKNIAFVISNSGKAKKLSEISFPPDREIPQPPSFIEIPTISEAILELDQDGQLRRWLKQIGIEPLSIERVVDKYIPGYLSQNVIEWDTSSQIIKYLFRLFSTGLIHDSHLATLQTMSLLNQSKGFSPARELYLPTDYRASDSLPLEHLMPNSTSAFLSPSYLTGEEQKQRLQFFLGLGLKTELKLHCVDEPTSVEELRRCGIHNLDSYLTYLVRGQNQILKDPITSTHQFTNFCYFPNMENMKHPAFANYFWNCLKVSSKDFLRIDKQCQFVTRNKQKRSLSGKKLSYIQYYLGHNKCILGTDNQYETITSLYSPDLQALNMARVTSAKIQSDLTDDLIKHLGFETHLSLELCYDLLIDLAKSRPDLKKYEIAIRQLVTNWDSYDCVQKKSYLRKPWLFVANNNQWRDVKSLTCFAVQGTDPTFEAGQWFKNILEETDMRLLAEHFGRPVEFGSINPSDISDEKLDTVYKDRVKKRLPLLAWSAAHYLNQPNKDVLKNLFNLLNQLNIYKECSIKKRKGMRLLHIAQLNNNIYYTNSCIEEKITEAIGNYLEFNGINQLKEFKDIFYLKEGISTRQAVNIQDWINDNGIPARDLCDLQTYLDQLTKCSNNTSSIPIPCPTSPELSQPPSPDIPDLNVESDEFFPPNPVTDPPSTAPVGSPGSPDDSIPHSPDPLLSSLPPPRGIKKLKIQSEPLPSKQPKAKKPAKKYKARTSEKQKIEIGKWGESFAFSELTAHYEKKSPSSFQLTGNDQYELTTNKGTKIALQWLNEHEESYEPYDMKLTKTKVAKPPVTKYIEIKSTQQDDVHFSMSSNEWDLMNKEPNSYRLYLVFNTGTQNAEMQKISKPLTWMNGKGIECKNTYKIRAKKLS